MKLRSFYYGLAAIVLVLLLIGGSSFSWFISRSPLKLLEGGTIASPAGMAFVPKQAPVAISLLANLSQLEALLELKVPPENRRRSRASLNTIKSSLLDNTGLDYQQDIEPWLGNEVTFAVTNLDIDRDRANGRQPGYLLIAKTRDGESARELLELFWQRKAIAGTNLVFESYNGVEIIYSQDLDSVATSVVGSRFALVANHPKVLRDAINNAQSPDANLINYPQYQQALATIENPRIGLVFLNLPLLAGLIDERDLLEGERGSDRFYQNLAIFLELNPEGILAETELFTAASQELTAVNPVLSAPVKALQYIPQSSILVAAGTNLEQLSQNLQTESSGYNFLSELVINPFQEIQKRWKLQLEEDIFTKVSGEYALGWLPRRKGLETDWIFVAEKIDTEGSLSDRLDEIAREQNYSIGPFDLQDKRIYAWTKLIKESGKNTTQAGKNEGLKTQVRGVRATVGNYEIFTSSINAMNDAINASQKGSIATHSKFEDSIAILEKVNDGYFYLDWDSGREIIERKFPLIKLLEAVGKPILDRLNTVTISSYGSGNKERKVGVFLKLGD